MIKSSMITAIQRGKKSRGFTLIEMLLVLAILSGMMVMFFNYSTQKARETRRDLAVLQIQEILNAGLAFYVNNGYWPVNANKNCDIAGDVRILVDNGYLPPGFARTPFGRSYKLTCSNETNNFSVETWFPNITEATIIQGRLPLAKILTAQDNSVQASVNIPGQNLNNARAVNFANLYKNGACVPAPKCPSSKMVPQIMVAPVSVSGIVDPINPAHPDSRGVSPINSFTAYAYGKPGAPPDRAPVLGGTSVALCNKPTEGSRCVSGDKGGKIDEKTSYWRVCLNVITSRGSTSGVEERSDVILAITRCAPPSEPTGSDFSVFVD